MQLKNQVSWITGAAGGIGRETSRILGEAGSKLVISDNNAQNLKVLTEMLKNKGIEVLPLPLNIANQEAVKFASEQIKNKYGKLDILINGAGISPKGVKERIAIDEMEESEWLRVLDVNLNGTFYCCKEAIKLMKPNKKGFIVNITSLAAKQYSSITGAHYCVSKAGMIALTRQLAGELGRDGIRVNAVAPGRIDTNMIWDVDPIINEQIVEKTPLQRLGEPEEVAEVVKFLVTDSSSFLTGTTIDINGGIAMH